MKNLLLVIASCFVALMAACSGDDDNTDPTPVSGQGGSDNAAACRELDEFQESLEAILRLNRDSSAADITSARNDAQKAFSEMETAMSAMSQETSIEIQNANSRLQASLGALPGVQNSLQVEELVKEPIAEMNRAVTEARQEVC